MVKKEKLNIDTTLHWAILGILVAIVIGMLGAAVRAGGVIANVEQNTGNMRDIRIGINEIKKGVHEIKTDVAVITDRIDREDNKEAQSFTSEPVFTLSQEGESK